MNWKRNVVCLLALAGGVSLFFSERGWKHRPSGLPAATRVQRLLPSPQLFLPLLTSSRGLAPILGAEFSPHVGRERHPRGPRADALSLPMTFEPNEGQIDSRVEFVGRGKGLTVLLMSDQIVVRTGGTSALGICFQTDGGRDRKGSLDRTGSGADFTWKGDDRLPGESNYFIGGDPRAWRSRVPHFAQAESARAARGVGLAIYGNDEGVEYDLRLAPGADTSKLRLALSGMEDLRLDQAGDLLMRVGARELRMKKPVVYEEVSSKWHSSHHTRRRALGASGPHGNATRRPRRVRKTEAGSKRRRKRSVATGCASKSRPRGAAGTNNLDVPCPVKTVRLRKTQPRTVRKRVEGAYVLEADGSIGFQIGPHDAHATLVIDPSLSVAYATFLGGSGADVAASLAMDSSGKIYVGGTTTSNGTFPEGSGARVGPADGPSEFFIAKIDPTKSGGSSLVYLTFLGGSGTQAGGLIAVDSSGDVAITGTTKSTDFPVTDTTEPTNGLASGFGNDVTVSEIDPTGTKLVFSTLFGGSGAESLNAMGGIALDSLGDVYIASDTNTTQLDMSSTDLPVTTGAFQTTWDGEPSDGFVAIFQPPATAGGAASLKYCSYLGSNAIGTPGVGGVAVDASGNAYIAGFAANPVNGFPVKNALQSAFGGGEADAFLMKISPLGNGAQDVVYATLLGGSGSDEALAVAVDSVSTPNAYVTGTTQSPNFPTNGATAAYQAALHSNATSNAFLAVVAQNALSGQTSLAYSTYIGGSVADAGQGVAVSAPKAVYVTGSTTSFDFPWHDNVQPFNGAGDAFVAKIDPTSAGAASLIYATPLGGTSPAGGAASASANAVAADQSGHVYLAGTTTSGDFPTAVTTQSPVNGFQTSCASCQQSPPVTDAFVAEIAEGSSQLPSVYFGSARIPFPVAPVGTVETPQSAAVYNGGEAPLTISDVEITGQNAADFSLSGQAGCLGQSANPGPSPACSFEVSFTPSIGGAEVAVVSITDNAPGSPQVLELVGAGQFPLAAVSPANVNFGNQPENSVSAAQTITLTNSGNQPITISQFQISGADAQQFPLVSGTAGLCTLGTSLQPGTACALSIEFTPTGEGPSNAEVDFFDNSENVANAEQVVPLSGVGTAAAPVATITPNSLGFGSETVGATSLTQSVTLTNKGSAALDLTGIGITGLNAADFAVAPAGTNCPTMSGTLVIGANCTVAVQFAPQTAGSKNASISFTDDAAGGLQQVSLSGTAVAAPTLTVAPVSIAFAAQAIGTTGGPVNVSVSNAGTAAAAIGTVSLTGTNPGDFTLGDSCAPSLAASSSCQVAVTFSPLASGSPGPRSATLNISGGTPAAVSLSGAATQPSVTVSAIPPFAPQLMGTAGTAESVNVTNTSSGQYAGALTVTSVTKTGANAADFLLVSDACTGANTPPGQSCSISVKFQPCQGGTSGCSAATCGANGGARSASLTLNDNVPGTPPIISLSGTAMEFCPQAAPGQGVSEPVPAGQQEQFSLNIDSSGGFTGTVSLGCAGTTTQPLSEWLASCSITTTPATSPTTVQVSPGTPGTFTLIVDTTAPGASQLAAKPDKGAPPWPGGYRVSKFAVIWAAVMALWAAWLWRRRGALVGSRRQIVALAQGAALLLTLAIGMAACGGGGATTSDPAPGTPPGNYTVNVTATFTTAGQQSVASALPVEIAIQ